jgi:sugar phosphate isomerase/epimerase
MYGGFRSLAGAADARTANQIKDVSENLNSGLRTIEAGAVGPDVFESIPKQHFKEMQRLAKLTGAELTFHAPMIDPTGITERGWDKLQQQAAEDQLWNSIKSGAELNPKGTVVTFHAASAGLPGAEQKVVEIGPDGKKHERIESLIFVTPDGKIGQIKNEKKYFPDEDTGQIFKPEESQFKFNAVQELKKRSRDEWIGQLSNLNLYAERAGQVIKELNQAEKLHEQKPKDKLPEVDEEAIGSIFGEKIDEKTKKRFIQHGDAYLKDAYKNMKANIELVSRILPNDSEEKKNIDEYIKKVAPQLKNFINPIDNVKTLNNFYNIVEDGMETLRKIQPDKVELLRPARQFAIEKSAETTANLAWKGFTDKDLKEKGISAPVIAIENHPAQNALITTAEDIRKVVEKARDNFIEKAKKSGMSKSEASKQAEKLIGATWDVGHINMMRRYGFDSEYMKKQAEIIAPVVKKVHLSDNFGYEHTELPMGMGNVPINEIMGKFKSGTEGFKDVKKIIEAGNWWQHFSPGGKTNHPLVPTLQGSGMGLYSGGPAMNQIYGTPAGYFAGYGTMLPENNFNMYGAGFSSLPMELGGQIATKDSRLSGTPMA